MFLSMLLLMFSASGALFATATCAEHAAVTLLLRILLVLLLLQGDPEVQCAKALRAAFEANDVEGVDKVFLRREALTL